ncbi:hypothetical protein VMCG_06419 [Cytospora schulzeri]|uniref:Uncharacterized protein n=1 Tax=Cytospora schulzeri TaxID=448051 RepID=A0A423W7W5_9PEZI|nr:hypothetical protein VMCG_06419 [Valsa malicola]
MSSSNANSPAYMEVADPCIACVLEMSNNPEARCMTDFGDTSIKNTSEEGSSQQRTTKKCKRCSEKNTGKDKPCVGVPAKAKDLAEEVITAAKAVSDIKKEMAKFVKRKEETFSSNLTTKNKIQRELIDPLQERLDSLELANTAQNFLRVEAHPPGLHNPRGSPQAFDFDPNITNLRSAGDGTDSNAEQVAKVDRSHEVEASKKEWEKLSTRALGYISETPSSSYRTEPLDSGPLHNK